MNLVELIKYPNSDDWKLCKQCALVTVGKEVKTEPAIDWRHSILEARHSPIRVLNFVFKLEINSLSLIKSSSLSVIPGTKT